ncbi:DUF1003 domain-containing protein [Kytococcus sedentarius]|uniref:Predicted membrane protein n=1 Tax=Kytococcus sedentarius (strain ATCC 14392 / DSM 20547 / JCM 11482 / CCUG 33030 / NBRC 15357 / NCTC 11040 / CCM 314 / 541) TaxID=478801 RepID=C7NKA0_KYTSD|nr:DUF1003 domain-containing protein [Kytococcus sedentarius]ACV06938.1 predicted membrane protein [Kytococcus sedentarius DSM 20547]QQB62944.1 DUF1003 domain-containing protein [Kytococcus sedentarius]STX14238.1 Predicted membrane protein [Kytococcus sedentarius]
MALETDPDERAQRLRELRERRDRRKAVGGAAVRSGTRTPAPKPTDRTEPGGGLATPQATRRRLPRPRVDSEAFGRASESFARFMGTPQFLLWMSLFVVVWLGWNTFMPESAQFDPRALNYTLLTLILSLQASYAAPLILLAQNRQDDRDRVSIEQDRARDERNLADTEFITREVASLRLTVGEMASRDYVRSELRDLLTDLLEELDEREARRAEDPVDPDPAPDTAQDAAPTEAPTSPRCGGATRSGTYDGGHAHS